MRTISAILWRKLDAAGHDACRLEQSDTAWQLDGAAVFMHPDRRIAQLNYRVRCDASWHAQWATVRGWLGSTAVGIYITRDCGGNWKHNGTAIPDLGHCEDVDLGFTPATNLIALRRLRLGIGESANAPAAWLDFPGDGLQEVTQSYQRKSENGFAYAAPRFGYSEQLEVASDGFVTHYPGLWKAEASADISY